MELSGKNALSIAETIASSIDGDKFQEYNESNKTDLYYENIQNIMNETKKRNKDIQYLYSIVDDGNNYKYIVSGFLNSESKDEWGYLGYTDPKDIYSDKTQSVLKDGIGRYTEAQDYGENYGMLISGFAPIKNSSGNVVGIVGVDLSVNKLLAEINTYIPYLAVIILVTSLIIFLLSYFINKKIIINPIKVTTEIIKKLSEGNITYGKEEELKYIVGLAQNNILANSRINDNKLLDFFEKEAKSKGYEFFCYSDLNGKSITLNKENSEINVSDRNYFKEAKEGKAYASKVMISRYTKRPVTAYSAPVYKDRKIVGVLYGVKDGSKLIGKANKYIKQKDEIGDILLSLAGFQTNLQFNILQKLEKISDGYLSIEVENFGDNDEITPALKKTRDSLKELTEETNQLIKGALAGNLENRGDDSKFHGAYKEIVKGINETLDAVVGPLNVTSEYVERISN